ncbi:MAG: oligopeptide ABC transporter permease OppB [Gammaproteobacteria bacterium]|nr:MAG: oligopeptide ABC transporter permease OppB [Gammaproteobacteria bacterium]
MFGYIVKRLLGAIPTMLLIMIAVFALIHIAPGGPFDNKRPMPAEVRANLNATYHLDEPLLVQFGYYLSGVVQGDFGPSYKFKEFTVTELIGQAFPVSLKLGISALIIALLVGVPAGMVAALKRDSLLDLVVMSTSMTGMVIPTFVLAPIMVMVFGVHLKWLPVAGWNHGALPNMVMPVIALSLPYVAYVARMTRGSTLEVLRSNYIRTAQAKGLPMRLVLFRHALKPALLPVVSFLGPAIAGIVVGSVVIERIFGLPGLGRYFVDGAINRDYTLVMGVSIFYAALLLLMNIVVDVAYTFLDPRVKLK